MKLFSVLLPILLTSWLNVACSSTTVTPAPNTAPPKQPQRPMNLCAVKPVKM